MSSRAGILDSIRHANVPRAAAACALTGEHHDRSVEGFLQALEAVGGHGVIRRKQESLHDVVVALVPVGAPGVVVRGRFAVAENGAVYVDADDLGARTDIVRAEHLLIVVPAASIVATMHEAVRLIPRGSRCGWFLSGPSKTADIEQSLVIGAQGARTLCVILEP